MSAQDFLLINTRTELDLWICRADYLSGAEILAQWKYDAESNWWQTAAIVQREDITKIYAN